MSVPHTWLRALWCLLGSGPPECGENVLCIWEREAAHLVGSLTAYMHNLQEDYDIEASGGSSTIRGQGGTLPHPLRPGFLGGENRPPASNTEMLITLVQGLTMLLAEVLKGRSSLWALWVVVVANLPFKSFASLLMSRGNDFPPVRRV